MDVMQTRATTVHRFVVEASVEENVQHLCSLRAQAMDLSAGLGKRSKAEEKMLSARCDHQTALPAMCSRLPGAYSVISLMGSIYAC